MDIGSNEHRSGPLSFIHAPANTSMVSKVIQDADDYTLVIWDVDGVLLIGGDRIFHSENIYSGLNDKYVDYIVNKYSLTVEQRDKFISQLLLQRPIELVDKILPGIIHELKMRYIKTIALTQFAVGSFGDIKNVADWRIEELNKLGVRFDFSFRGLDPVELDTFTKFNGYYPLYKQGVLFCNRHPKGEILGAFLNIIKWKPNKIICIDDQMESLELVQAELKQRNIDFIGLHYTVSLDFPSEIDDKVVKLQYEHIMENGVWLTDQMALEKLKDI